MFFPISATIGSKTIVGFVVCILPKQTPFEMAHCCFKHFNNCPLNIFSYIEVNAIFDEHGERERKMYKAKKLHESFS